MGALLDVQAVRKVFGGLVAVNDVTFSVPDKAIVSVIGPNGAGKTTFFNMITGIYKPTAGTITFDGRNMIGLRPDEVVTGGIAVYSGTGLGTRPGANVGTGIELPLTGFSATGEARMHLMLSDGKPVITLPLTVGIRF